MRFDFIDFATEREGSVAWVLGTHALSSGIYWLTFADGQEYVGQSVHIGRRLSSHRRRWLGEIVRIRVAHVAPEHLDAAERTWIARRELEGASLRNKDLTRRPMGAQSVEVTVATGEVVPLSWERSARGRVAPHDRVATADATPAMIRNHAKLSSFDVYDGLCAWAYAFLDACIPSPVETAHAHWTLTALPATNRGVGRQRLMTLNAGRLEILRVFEFESDDETSCEAVVNMDAPDRASYSRLEERVVALGGELQLLPSSYAEPVVGLYCWADDLPWFVGDETIADLVYALAVRSMRRGSNPLRRHHNPLFLQDVIRIGQAGTA